MKSMTLIAVRDVTFGYAHPPVLRNISVSFQAGEVVSLLGPNGSGKTTLLKIVLGLLPPQRGDVLLEGLAIRAMTSKQLARRIAYVPQFHRIAFGYRVLDVVLMGRMPHKPFFFRYDAADERVAARALERLCIAHLKDRPYSEVSGGERQLVLIARALAQGADIFVMDEPVNGLDYGNQIRLPGRIADLSRSGYTFIKTTHFPDHALWGGDAQEGMRGRRRPGCGNRQQGKPLPALQHPCGCGGAEQRGPNLRAPCVGSLRRSWVAIRETPRPAGAGRRIATF